MWNYRLDLTPEQSSVLDRQADAARSLWNLIHACWLMVSENRSVELARLDREVRQAVKDIEWMRCLPAQAAQQVLSTYLNAWRACWDGTREAPTWHRHKDHRPAVDIPQARDLKLTRLSRKYAGVKVPKLGVVRYRNHRPLPTEARVTGARAVVEHGHWMLALRVELPKPTPLPAGRPVIGADKGVTIPLALSDGTELPHDPFLTARQSRRRFLLERRSARQRRRRWVTHGKRTQPGANETKTYDALASLRNRATRRRHDWQHQTSARIAADYSAIAFEALRVKNMTASAAGTVNAPGSNVAQKAGLNHAILNEAWSLHQSRITYKVESHGGVVLTVPAPGTSTECHACGSTAPGQRENQASFRCANPACDWAGNADLNAARNIEYRAFGWPDGHPKFTGPRKRRVVVASPVGLTDAACTGYTPVTPNQHGSAVDSPTLVEHRRQEQDTAPAKVA